MQKIAKYIDVFWLVKFLLIGFLLYYISIAYNGLISPEGRFYNSFLDQYLNYIAWIRNSIMLVSNFIAKSCGVSSYITGPQTITTTNGAEVEIWLPCLGLGITGFWISFVVTNKGFVKKKMLWCLSGMLVIWLINCFRIAILVVALDKNWKMYYAIDHHDLFNWVAYTFIFMLMYLYTKNDHSVLNC